jgi:valyl-tRNA synthetase
MKVPLCEKSKDVIEPLLKPQWWMRMGDMTAEAKKVVERGDIKILPESAEKSYLRWMENVNDWCLSRQLWWGHQAPAYFVDIEGEPGEDSDGERWVVAKTEAAAEEKARAKFPGKKFALRRDPDVLEYVVDRVLSGSLLMDAAHGSRPGCGLSRPSAGHRRRTTKTVTFRGFTRRRCWRLVGVSDPLESIRGPLLTVFFDIIFFWVARMIMLGLKMTGKPPFREGERAPRHRSASLTAFESTATS